MTDGAGDLDLTLYAGMKPYWQTIMANYTSSWRIAAGVYRDHYIVSINNGTSLIDCFVVDLNRRTMVGSRTFTRTRSRRRGRAASRSCIWLRRTPAASLSCRRAGRLLRR
jgi:hypothetical protein